MPQPSLFILYVENPSASAAFYRDLLGVAPLEVSETFALFRLECGASLAFWSRHTVEPAPGAAPGAGELGFRVEDVNATHRDWAARGLTILQPPADLDFGRACMALDPDGHRLRAYRLAE